MTERRKLNNVYQIPCKPGYVSVRGEIGSGKTREDVLLVKYAPIDGVDLVTWYQRIGELWRVLEPLTKKEVN